MADEIAARHSSLIHSVPLLDREVGSLKMPSPHGPPASCIQRPEGRCNGESFLTVWFNVGTGATYKALEFWRPIKSNSFIIKWGGELA